MRPAYNVRDFHREFGSYDPDTHNYIPELPPAADLPLWRAWFTQHGIDPAEVLLTHWVERRVQPEQMQIVWLEDGVRDGQPITVERHQDLAQPPAPFPVD